jgi:hypothetical protein
MLADLEAAAADSLHRIFGGRHEKAAPAPGAVCANCDTVLQGPYCHHCGQDADPHKRSLPHLAWEAVEGLLHLDGRLMRTAPDLFLHPGRLARDYMENRVARHVPPFRTFLVALLLFIFAAEHAAHETTVANAREQAARAARLTTPQGRAAEAASLRQEADKDRLDDLAEAAHDRDLDLVDPDEDRAKTEAAYARETAKVQARYAAEMAKAARVAAGLPADTAEPTSAPSAKPQGWWKAGLHKAIANPEYFLSVMFTWGHRVAVLLLPIVGFTLALVYHNKPQYFLHDHLLVAMNLLSFTFLTNAVGLVLPGMAAIPWLVLVAIWTPVNLFQTLRGAYGSSILGAGLKTLIVWLTTVVSFSVLTTGLIVFSLTQL